MREKPGMWRSARHALFVVAPLWLGFLAVAMLAVYVLEQG